MVSVVLPAFNAAATIVETIRSVLAQSHADFELLICDDCSQDETVLLVGAVRDARIQLIRNERNIGPGRSRDRAIVSARGSWIAFLDADDAWASNRLELLLSVALQHDGAMIFDDMLLCQQKNGRIVPWKRARLFPAKAGAAIEISLSEYISAKSLMNQPLVPRASITNLQLNHSARRYGEDAEFFIRLMHAGIRAWYVNVPLYHYRLTPGSLSTQVSRNEEMAAMLAALGSELEFAPDARAALEVKLSRLRRKANYDRFVVELRGTGFGKAPARLAQDPRLALEFAKRLPHAIMIRVRAWLYGATGR